VSGAGGGRNERDKSKRRGFEPPQSCLFSVYRHEAMLRSGPDGLASITRAGSLDTASRPRRAPTWEQNARGVFALALVRRAATLRPDCRGSRRTAR